MLLFEPASRSVQEIPYQCQKQRRTLTTAARVGARLLHDPMPRPLGGFTALLLGAMVTWSQDGRCSGSGAPGLLVVAIAIVVLALEFELGRRHSDRSARAARRLAMAWPARDPVSN